MELNTVLMVYAEVIQGRISEDARCPVCGSNKSCVLYRTKVLILRCTQCSHAFTAPHSIDHQEAYQEDYYENTHRNWFSNPNIPLFRWIASNLPNTTRQLLDAGCGKGDFLRYLRDHAGWPMRLVGVDFSANKPETGIEYYQGDLLQMPSEEKFDAVVSLAVIEHVTDPIGFAHTIAARCRGGGVVVVMTLNNDSLLYSCARLLAKFGIKGPADRLYSQHHLQHFTRNSLVMTLELAGCELVSVHHHNTPLAAIDFPAPNRIVRNIFLAGVAMLYWLGLATNKAYLQTIIARRRGFSIQ